MSASTEVMAAPVCLGLNRCLSLSLIEDQGQVVGVEVNAPIPGSGLRVTRIDAGTQRDVFDLLIRLRDSPRLPGLTLDAPVAEQLQSAGVLLPRTELPRSVRYACFIDGHGVPESAQTLPQENALSPWIVNPTLRVLQGTGSFAAQWPMSTLAEAAALAWLTLPGSDVPFAYWLNEEDQARLSQLSLHELLPHQLEPAVAQRYARAGLLTTTLQVIRGMRCLRRRQRRRREHLEREGWVRLSGLVPAPLLASLQGYVTPLIEQGHLRFNDAQSRRYFKHSEAMSVWLHQQTEAGIQSLIADPIKRSYAFLGGYVEGSDLPLHVDRAQCEYTLSITLEAQPSRRRIDAWPLGLTDRHGIKRSVRLAPGDGLLFKGRELPHFREPLALGRRSTSVFLHFVPVDFSGHLN